MKRDYPDRPIAAVGVVVIKDDCVLLIRRGKPPKLDCWSIPGGAQELGETTQETALREVYEETAIIIEKPKLLTVLDLLDRDQENGIRHHYTLIDYMADYRSGNPKAGGDVRDAKWVPITELSAYNLWSETEKIIKSANEKLQKVRK